MLYRAPAQNGAAGAAQLGSSTIHLTGADLKDQYLRVTWAPAQGGVDLAANVALRGATVTTSRSAAAAARPTVQVNLPTQNKPHELGFSLPFATPVAAIGITPQGSNVLVPVRVLGRNGNQQPWTSLAEGVVYSLQTAGVDQRSAAITLPSYQGNSWRDIRVEADTKTPGFTAPPAVSVLAPGQPLEELSLVCERMAPDALVLFSNHAPGSDLPRRLARLALALDCPLLFAGEASELAQDSLVGSQVVCLGGEGRLMRRRLQQCLDGHLDS